MIQSKSLATAFRAGLVAKVADAICSTKFFKLITTAAAVERKEKAILSN